MNGRWWVGCAGDDHAFRLLCRKDPELQLRIEDSNVFLGPLKFINQDSLRREIDRFIDSANVLLLFLDPNAGRIRLQGPLYREDDDGRRHHVLLADAGVFSSVFYSVTLRTSSDSGQQPRGLKTRVAELCAQSDHFRKASVLLANAGEDLREIFKSMEAIEKGNGGWINKNRTEREAFCASIQVSVAEWKALRQTARPARHAYSHDVDGLVYTPKQAQAVVQRALKAWLDREVPV